MKSFKAEKNGKLSEEMLSFYKSEITYGKTMSLIRKKDVKVNGKRTGADVAVFAGDDIEVYYDGETRKVEEIYSDENVLAAYKPKGITSEDFFGAVKKTYESAGFIHRLDRNTDGVMIFSLSPAAQGDLLKGFKARAFQKYYLAEVYGAPKERSGKLVGYLKKDAEKAVVKIYDEKTRGAERIETEYEVLKRSAETSVLKVRLVTGKTHQIRAHLAHAGFFVLGDGKYGKESVNRKFRLSSQRLTAYSLTLKFDGDSPLYYLDGKEFVYSPALGRFGLK